MQGELQAGTGQGHRSQSCTSRGPGDRGAFLEVFYSISVLFYNIRNCLNLRQVIIVAKFLTSFAQHLNALCERDSWHVA